MKDDVREAAERLLSNFWSTYREVKDLPVHKTIDRVLADARLVAEAFLAEHPAADGEAITADIFRNSGWEQLDEDGHDFETRTLAQFMVLELVGLGSWTVYCEDRYIATLRTRRDLRDFCRLAGVQLKEEWNG